jgi:hypothetical protein
MLTEIQAKWLGHLLSTEPSDRPRAEAALSAWYPVILQRPAPEYFFWFDCPKRAGWAVKLLESATENLWQRFVEHKSNRREGRLFVESLRAELCDKAGLEWEQLTQIAGRHRTQQSPNTAQRRALHGFRDIPWQQLQTRVHPYFADLDKENEMCRVEDRFNAVVHPLM